MIEDLTREAAFRIATGTIQAEKDYRGIEQEPELLKLERLRPDLSATTRLIRTYLEKQIVNCGKRRRDSEAIQGLAEALTLSASLLTAPEIKEGAFGGPIASMRRTFQELAATLSGETLPEPQCVRHEMAEVAHG